MPATIQLARKLLMAPSRAQDPIALPLTQPVDFPRVDTPTILLVDDDPAVRSALGRVLAAEGWQVICAATGEEALECLAEQRLDLVITDLCMADVSGWDLLFHESIQRPYLPIFVITGLSPGETGGADRFAAMFFPKPLDLDGLIAAIHRHIGKSATAEASASSSTALHNHSPRSAPRRAAETRPALAQKKSTG